ncbi:site-specific integrase [Tabrizicola sp.]|uniref:site-specific integrase n=1 Tax=Tabrizicola sp. TaxID=2005166 RepID=UPI0035AF6EED
MAGKLRHWREKDGRFYARLAVPKELVPFVGRSELIEPLGSDRRGAMRQHPAAVARLQAQITKAGMEAAQTGAIVEPLAHFPMTDEQLAARLYQISLELDDQGRLSRGYASIGIDDGYVATLRSARAGALSDSELYDLVGPQIERFRLAGNVTAAPASREWRRLAQVLCEAELEALSRMVERDEGDFTGTPPETSVVRTALPDEPIPPVPLSNLFDDYIKSRQALGKHTDGGRRWNVAIKSLVKHLGHSDARKITKRDLNAWLEALQAEGIATRTVANVYLASVRAVLRWAHEKDRLPSNASDGVRQEVRKTVRSRERGYTLAEAKRLLRASVGYIPAEPANPSNREKSCLTAAKRWIPILCAFTGARVVEVAQLRKEDARKEGQRWVIRISPEAGSVKTGVYRDVPLHPQIISLGFIDFVKSSKSGPLFHNAAKPEKYLDGARVTAGRLSEWLNRTGVVPEGVQPSHGWRHRFKTLGRELGLSDRIVDAIQGHAGRTAGDGYGDVSILAMARVIDALPDYDLTAEFSVAGSE